MQLLEQGDATFVSGWQPPYAGKCPLTGSVLTGTSAELGKKFISEFFPKLAAKIKSRVAFAILAPDGWPGEAAWRPYYDALASGEFGWKPSAWKESTHLDKTFVQLFQLNLDRPEASERPKIERTNRSIPYSGTAVGSLPYLGCSSILSAYDTEKMEVELPKPKMYRGVASDKCLHFLRIARPASKATVAMLKEKGFTIISKQAFNSYWVRAKLGLGTQEACEY